jgi:hypothetical protein
MAKKVVKIIGLTASGETTATPIGEIVGLISDAIQAKDFTASSEVKVPVVKASFSPSVKPISSGTSSSTSFSITGEAKSLAKFNETGSGLTSSDIYHGSDGYGVGTPEPFWKWDVNQGSINVTQGSDTDGYRINGKLVVNIIDSEVILGNTTYSLVKVTDLNVSSLTASELTATDANKNLQSLAVATYPSLAEVSYVKGVTNSIQDQIDLKFNIASFTDVAVTSKLLTGLSISGTSVAATDSILVAVGKLQAQVTAQLGGLIFQSTWNATTNTPTITSSTGTKGHYYIVSTAGATSIDGEADWKAKDWVVFNGATWDKVDNTDSVSSVNGELGAVSLTTDDITEGVANLYYTDAAVRSAISESIIGIDYNNSTGIFSTSSGYGIPTTIKQGEWDTAYTLASSSWLLNGNTIGAKKTFGSLDAYDVGIIRGGTEIITIGSLGATITGNFGIGTPSPSQKLHVDGSARVTGAYYDSGNTSGTANQLLASTATGTAWIDQSTIVAEAATLVVIACKNTSGAAIAQGTPVYQTGTVGATATIEIAPADALISENKLPAIGLLQTALNNNEFGFVVITGELTNFTTSPIDGIVPTTGDKVFVKSGGGLTLTKPTGEGNGIQNMGLVGKVSGGNAGSITVSSIMRANDVPNLPEGRIWVGDGNTIVSDTVYVDEPNNRVGIGTVSPQARVDITNITAGDSSEFLQKFTWNKDFWWLGVQQQHVSGSHIQYNIVQNYNGTQKTLLGLKNGTVGIATSTPNTGYDFHVSGTQLNSNTIESKMSADVGGGNLIIRSASTDTKGLFARRSTASETDGTFFYHLNNYAFPLNLALMEDGKVGVGTILPTELFDVNGTGRFTNAKITASAALGYIAVSDSSGSIIWTDPSALNSWQGNYNASTDTPSLSDGTGTYGNWYHVEVAGTNDFGSGNITFALGDRVIYDGSEWIKQTQNYTLNDASASVLGGIKIGSTLEIASGVANQKSGIVTVGTYRSVTVDTYGRVTGGTNSTLAIADGGTGSATQNFVDLTTAQTIAGIKTFSVDAVINGLTVGRGLGNISTNSAFGLRALYSNTSGGSNTGVGIYALYNNLTATGNTGIGSLSLYSTTSGSQNTAVGADSLKFNTTGAQNTSIGLISGLNITTGNYNTFLAYNAGGGITTGSGNTIIGYNINGLSAALADTLIIGAGGRKDLYGTATGIGISTALPNSKLEITGGGASTTDGALRLTNSVDSYTFAIINGIPSQTNSGFSIYDVTADVNRFVINGTTGRIGIGVAAPTEELDLLGNFKYSGTLKPSGTAGTVGQFLGTDGTNDAWQSITQTVTLTDSPFERVLEGIYLAADTDESFFIGTDQENGQGVLRFKYYDDSEALKTNEMSFDREDNFRPYFYDPTASSPTYKKVAWLDELDSVNPSLQTVTAQGRSSTDRLQYNSGGILVNYALTSDIVAASGIDSVLGIGDVATDSKYLTFRHKGLGGYDITGIGFQNSSAASKGNIIYGNSGEHLNGQITINSVNLADLILSSAANLKMYGEIYMTDVRTDHNYTDDMDAGANGILAGQLYHTSGILKIKL